MRIVFTFYRNFLWIVLCVTLVGCFLIAASGSWQLIVLMFWTKVITNILLGVFIDAFSPAQFYFFKNLGYGKLRLYTYTFMLDMSVWFILSLITVKLVL